MTSIIGNPYYKLLYGAFTGIVGNTIKAGDNLNIIEMIFNI